MSIESEGAEVGETLRDASLPLDLSKIQTHAVEPKGLRLRLTGWSHGITARLYLGGYDRPCEVGEWDNKQDAERGYASLLNKFDKGQYKIHTYTNGKIEVEFLG